MLYVKVKFVFSFVEKNLKYIHVIIVEKIICKTYIVIFDWEKDKIDIKFDIEKNTKFVIK